jgi:hypothetical protein
MELCPKIMKNGERLGFLGVLEFWGETMKMGVKKGRRWCGGEQWWLKDAAMVMGSGVVAWRWCLEVVCGVGVLEKTEKVGKVGVQRKRNEEGRKRK